MVLILEVTGPQAAQLGSACRKVFGTDGGVIGRDSRNAWVLPHTKVSGRHASISFQNGVFYIEDTSTNGVFVNGSKNRLGKGRTFALKSGDSILIDPYVITVTVSASEHADRSNRRSSPAPRSRTPAPRQDPFGLDDPFAEQDVPFGERIVPTLDDPHAEPLVGHEVDPLKLLGGHEPPRRQAKRTPPRAEDLDRASPLEGHFQPPRAIAPTPPPATAAPRKATDPFAIPEDYDPLAPATKYRIEQPSRPAPEAPTPPPPRSAPPPRVEADPVNFDLDDLAEALNPEAVRAEPDVEPEEPVVAPTARAQSAARVVMPPPPPPSVARGPTPPPAAPSGVRGPTPPPAAPSSARVVTPPTPPPAEQRPPVNERAVPPSAPPPPPPATADNEALTIDLRGVLEGAGLDPEDVTPELARDFGQILRIVVGGIMEVLQARHNVKDEFRMRVTQFRQADNNPLKFSANVDDALHNLLVKRNAAYLRPIEAFDDAFDDLRHHQLAMLAGMRTAFEAMLNEFQPDRLQEQFDGQRKGGGLLAVTGKMRYWDRYCDLHEDLLKDPEVTFRRLFGDAFAKAYEDQLQRLKAQNARSKSVKPPESDI